jgi:hypothetical protein
MIPLREGLNASGLGTEVIARNIRDGMGFSGISEETANGGRVNNASRILAQKSYIVTRTPTVDGY